MEILLGTGEVARFCGVSEATIKRWADEGALPCIRTVGGHRRYRAGEVRQFLQALGYEPPAGLGLPDTGEPDPEGVALYALNDEFDRVVSRFVDRALRPGSGGPESILRTLLTIGLPLAALYDRVVVPALGRLGSMKELGEIGAVVQDVAAAQIEEAVVLAQPQASRLGRRRRGAVVAALAPEPPVLPVRLVANLLDADGWTVAVSPSGVPGSALVDYLRTKRPALLCVPGTTPGEPSVLREQAALLHGASRDTGTTVILVGEAVARLSPPPPADRIVADLPSLVEASREV
jgi:excisionase family DNA binding protein